MSDDASVKDLEDRKVICERAAATAVVIAGGNALAELLPWPLTATAAGVALVALLAAWQFSVEVRRARRRQHEREQAAAHSARRSAVDAALRTAVGAVGDLELEDLGVDPVDPRVLTRALRVDGDQLAYVRRDVDARLRAHLARARDSDGPTLVCLHGPSKAGKSRSMLHALTSELPDALLVAPDRTRANLQTIIDERLLQRLADGSDRTVVLWLDDLEGFVRLQDTGVDHRRIEDLKRHVPGLVVVATAGGRGLQAHTDTERTQLQQPLSDCSPMPRVSRCSRDLSVPMSERRSVRSCPAICSQMRSTGSVRSRSPATSSSTSSSTSRILVSTLGDLARKAQRSLGRPSRPFAWALPTPSARTCCASCSGAMRPPSLATRSEVQWSGRPRRSTPA